MRSFVLISFAVAVSSASIISDLPQEGYKEGDRYFYFPGDGDGELHLVDTLEPVDETFIARSADYNAYWLYTRSNPNQAQILIFEDANSVSNSSFDPAKVTVFLAHGWKGNGSNEMNKNLTSAFLENDDVNVIVLDWSSLAERNYLTAMYGVAAVGRGLGQFINWLATLGVSFERVHIVGFSLGGHLVGNAGRELGGKIRRITSLDPAGPLWSWNNHRIVKTDAQYVEIIHTHTAFFGFAYPCGDADFYPNGGSVMPGCTSTWFSSWWFFDKSKKSCSHSKAYEYMASSVKHNNLLANKCKTVEEAKEDKCTGELKPMGNADLEKNVSGIFRVNIA